MQSSTLGYLCTLNVAVVDVYFSRRPVDSNKVIKIVCITYTPRYRALCARRCDSNNLKIRLALSSAETRSREGMEERDEPEIIKHGPLFGSNRNYHLLVFRCGREEYAKVDHNIVDTKDVLGIARIRSRHRSGRYC